MERWCRLPCLLQPIREKADRIVSFGMHHHQCAGVARGREDLKELVIAERQILISHENLEGRLAVVDKCGELLAENAGRRI